MKLNYYPTTSSFPTSFYIFYISYIFYIFYIFSIFYIIIFILSSHLGNLILCWYFKLRTLLDQMDNVYTSGCKDIDIIKSGCKDIVIIKFESYKNVLIDYSKDSNNSRQFSEFFFVNLFFSFQIWLIFGYLKPFYFSA